MNAQYLKGGIIMLVCIAAFVFASRKQFYQRQRGSEGRYSEFVGNGCSRILWILIKILAILMFLYGLTMILIEKDGK